MTPQSSMIAHRRILLATPRCDGHRYDPTRLPTRCRHQTGTAIVELLAPHCDLLFVVGSAYSSRLLPAADEAAGPTRIIDFPEEVDPAWLEGIGTIGIACVSAVADVLVTDLLCWFAERGFTDVNTILPTAYR